LAKAGFKDISIFKAVYCIPEIIWLNWAVVNDQRRLGKITGKLLYPEIQYMEWKGFTCKTHGYKALVDDNIRDCKMGCNRYEIKLFDVAEFNNT
jgi:hypothetical protein